MKEQKKKDTENMALFERLGGTYTRDGSGLYCPNLQLSEGTTPHYGKYGMMRKSFLKEHKQGLYAAYVLSGKLVVHLNAIDEQANDRLDLLMVRMMKVEGVDEKMKETDWEQWLKFTNSIVNRAEEIVLKEIVYSGKS